MSKKDHFIQQLADAFWRKWTVFYFPSLVIQPKWHHEKRDMLVGDIVIIQDSKLPRGQWKLGCISEVLTLLGTLYELFVRPTTREHCINLHTNSN